MASAQASASKDQTKSQLFSTLNIFPKAEKFKNIELLHEHEFITTLNGTRIVAICGVTDIEGKASPRLDSWFLSDFYLFLKLFQNAHVVNHVWLAMIRKSYKYFRQRIFYNISYITSEKRKNWH